MKDLKDSSSATQNDIKNNMLQQPFYDPNKSYEENSEEGPYGAFANADESGSTVSADSKYSFLGFKINSPFGIASGPLPNSKFTTAAFKMGFDVVCYKTRRSTSFASNAWPNVLFVNVDGDLTLEKAKTPLHGSLKPFRNDTKYSITNSFGNPSQDGEVWAQDLKKAIDGVGKGQLLISSVVGTIQEGFSPDDYYEDFADTAEIADKAGAEVIELNLSCPNVASEGVLCYSPEAVLAICQKVRARIGDKPIVVKFGYFSEEQQALLEKIIGSISKYINAVSVINTIPAAVVDEKGEQALPGKGRLMSGVCGAGIKWAGLDMVRRLNSLRKEKDYKFEIIGIGGVMTPEDFEEYRAAGADVVQSATGAMWNPFLAQEIKAKVNTVRRSK